MNLLSQQNGPIPMPLLSIGTATDITNNTFSILISQISIDVGFGNIISLLPNNCK